MAKLTVTIKNIELLTLERRNILLSKQFYVRFSIGDTIWQTPTAKEKKNYTCWREDVLLDGEDTSALRVEVYQKHHLPWKSNELVGTFTYVITGRSKDRVIEERLRKNVTDGIDTTGITIKFSFTTQFEGPSADELQAANAVAIAMEGKAKIRFTPAPIDQPNKVGAGTVAAAEPPIFESFLQKLVVFNNIVTNIAEIHPYASMAWSVISVTNKLLINQKYRDEQVIRLVDTMNDVFSFVHDTEPLNKVKKHVQSITLLLQQVTECGYFIADYAKPNNFFIRAAKYSVSDVDARITDYQTKLRELKTAFLDGVALQTGITVVRMMNIVNDIGEAIVLNDLPRAVGARYEREKECLPGTRVSFIQELCDILNDPAEDAPCVCLLTGVAGSGKSAVAHSIAHLFDGQKRLGSSYCFSSAERVARNPRNLFTTIARDLCNHDRPFKSALLDILNADPALSTSTSASEQMERFIVEPSKRLDAIGPVVIIIDALDESGDRDSRRPVLETLSRQLSGQTLPTNLRFLITARPESDILAAFPPGPHLVHKQMGDISEEIVNGDIERFIRHSLDRYHELELSWPNGEWCRLLVRHSQHLFQWAATACKFIQELGVNPRDQVEILLQGDDKGSLKTLDELYLTILRQLFTSEKARQSFRDVMAIVLVLYEPLPLASLSALFNSNPRIGVPYIVKPMGSLLDGINDENKPIRPLHTSFRDFLLDEARSSTFYVHILPDHLLSLGQALLACMRDKLKFNICGLEDSRSRNDAVPDLPERVKNAIRPHLSYACRFWMNHLQYVTCTPELLKDVTSFFSDLFPYWLEAISLLSLSSPQLPILGAQETCVMLTTWAKDHEIAMLALEASRFIQVFSPILQTSTPHLYLSAMPQTPSSSPLCKLWHVHLLKHTSITSGNPASWPPEVHTLQGHTGCVNSVAYSPNGRYIVSGSDDWTIRIWDVVTSQTVSVIQEHGGGVNCVSYSPDGRHIASCSNDRSIGIWDAITGESVGGLFQGHIQSVNCIAYSPNGKYIVSGSQDNTVRVWDTITGETVAGPFQHGMSGIKFVAYSPDGQHIVSGPYYGKIQIWNINTGEAVASFNSELTILSVAFSPDARHVVFSEPHSIIFWDITTGEADQCIGDAGIFMGVNSVAYSPDGRQFAFGSYNETIRALDVITGRTVAGPFKGHTDTICSIAYSSDGRYIVSGSRDNTIRIWDTTAHQIMLNPHQQLSEYAITSIVYSPDGRHIASGSADGTIMIWDATTGQTVVGPFQPGNICAIYSMIYSSDGKHIAFGLGDTIRIMDATTGQTVTGPFQCSFDIHFVSCSPDERYIIAGSRTHQGIQVWDITTGQMATDFLQEHTISDVTSIAYSPDGRYIVFGSYNIIIVLDVTTSEIVAGPFQEEEDISSMAYSFDGKHIISHSSDGTIRIWDVASGQISAGPFKENPDVISFTYSPKNMHILFGSKTGTIWIWDVITNRIMTGPYKGHMTGVDSVVYSPDGRYIASGSQDESIKVWKTQEFISYPFMFIDDGWIQSSNGHISGWVAPWNRHFHWFPFHSLIISSHGTCSADVDTSLFGESWVSCWK